MILTWAVPSWTTLIAIDQHSEAKQTAVWRCGIIRAALRFVEEEQMAAHTNELSAFIHNLRVRRLHIHTQFSLIHISLKTFVIQNIQSHMTHSAYSAGHECSSCGHRGRLASHPVLWLCGVGRAGHHGSTKCCSSGVWSRRFGCD